MPLTRSSLLTVSALLILSIFSRVYAGEAFSPMIEGNKTIGVQVKTQHFSASDAQNIKDSGFGFVRFGVWTHSLGSPAYQNQVNQAFAAAKSANLPVLLTVRSTKALPIKAQDSVDDLASEGAAFADAIIGMETKFGTQLLAIEIWNEPDLPKYWPTGNFELTFVPFMTAVCNSLKTRAHSTPLVGFGFAHAPTAESKSTVALTKIITEHPKCLAAVSYHPYGMSGPEISNAQAFIHEKFNLPGVITEWGVPSLSSIGGPEGQASRITKFIGEVRNLNIPLTSLYEWKNSDTGGNDREKSFGLRQSDGKPKPAETAVKNLLQAK